MRGKRIELHIKIKKTSTLAIVTAAILVIGTVTEFATGAASSISAETAVNEFTKSIKYKDGQIVFIIPKDYNNVSDWNILIAGRKEIPDFGGMSVHLFEEENSQKTWKQGKTYTIQIDGEYYTDLLMEVTLPDGVTKMLIY